MKYYIISGEASGDLHGSNLIKEIKKIDTNSSFRCWGGDLMKEQGGDIVKHYKDLAFMGFFEVLMKIRTILNNIKWCKKDIIEHQPESLPLVYSNGRKYTENPGPAQRNILTLKAC